MFYRCWPVYLLSQRFLHVSRMIPSLRQCCRVEAAPVAGTAARATEVAAQVAETAVLVVEIVAVEAAVLDLHAAAHVRQIVLTVAKEVQNHQAVLGAQIHAAGVVKEHQNHQAVPGAQIHAAGVVKEHQNLHHAQTVPAIAAADVMTAALTPAKEVVAAHVQERANWHVQAVRARAAARAELLAVRLARVAAKDTARAHASSIVRY